MRADLWLACSVYCLALPLAAQSMKEEILPPRQLFEYKQVQLQTPPFNSAGNSRCDGSGNLYFKLDSEDFNDANIVKLSPTGDRATVYNQPHDDRELTAYAGYAISPNETLFVLLEMRSGYSVLKFNSKGDVANAISIKVPVGIKLHSLAVLDDGTMFIAGDQAKGTHLFRAIVASTGEIRKILGTGSACDKVGPSQVGQPALPPGDAIGSVDGKFYVLMAEKIFVISRSGVVEDEFKLNKPKAELTPIRLDVSEGHAAIELVRPEKSGAANSTYLVLDLINRNKVGWYIPSSETGTDLVCYTHQDGFIFARIKKDRLELRMAGIK